MAAAAVAGGVPGAAGRGAAGARRGAVAAGCGADGVGAGFRGGVRVGAAVCGGRDAAVRETLSSRPGQRTA